MLKKIEIIMIFVVLGSAAFAAPDYYADDIYFGSVVDYGLGGPYTTDNEGLEILFSNPAALRSAEKDFEFLGFTAHLKGPVMSVAELLSSSLSGEQDMADVLSSPAMQEVLDGLYMGVDLGGPLNVGYIGENFGFGLFNSTKFLAQETGPLSFSINLSEEVFFAGGYSIRIPLTEDERNLLDLGLSLKAGVVGEVVLEKSFLELPAMLDDIGADLFTGQPFELSKILSADAGALYSWDDQLSAGVVFQDFYSVVFKDSYVNGIDGFFNSEVPLTEIGKIPFKMNVGVEYSPEIKFLEKVFTGFRVMAGYDDLLDFLFYPSEADSWLLQVHSGVELSILNVFDFRVGIAEGLLNAGLGLDFKILKVDAAVFGTERSSQPGTSPVYNIALSITI